MLCGVLLLLLLLVAAELAYAALKHMGKAQSW
jgi:hypothetical protein